jgi:hypothetical protein
MAYLALTERANPDVPHYYRATDVADVLYWLDVVFATKRLDDSLDVDYLLTRAASVA